MKKWIAPSAIFLASLLVLAAVALTSRPEEKKKTIFDLLLEAEEIYPPGYELVFLGGTENCTNIQFSDGNGTLMKIYRCDKELEDESYRGPIKFNSRNYYYSTNKAAWNIAMQTAYKFASALESLERTSQG